MSIKKFRSKEIDKVLMDLGKDITDAWRKKLQNHKDTGSLYSSINYKVKDQILIMTMNESGKYLDEGTAAHMPPVDKIAKWAARKGLSPWAVAVNISKYGTKAYPFIDEYIPVLKKAKKDFQKAGRQDIVDMLNSQFKEKTTTIKIK